VKRCCADGPPTDGTVAAMLRGAILKFDQTEAAAYEKANIGIQGGWPHSSGSTAVCTIVTPTAFVVANVGDSRLVLFRGAAVIPFATVDHKPTHRAEKRRVKQAGGRVMLGRVNGVLAMTRALGNFEQKNPRKCQEDQVISPCPEITVLKRSATDEALVIASDGLWDVMTVEGVGEFVRPRLPAVCGGDGADVCEALTRACLSQGSKDNVSAMIVAFDLAADDTTDDDDGECAVLDVLVSEHHTRLDAANTATSTLSAFVAALIVQLAVITSRAGALTQSAAMQGANSS
jgi:serine/threonine protein phosphatase PrpC